MRRVLLFAVLISVAALLVAPASGQTATTDQNRTETNTTETERSVSIDVGDDCATPEPIGDDLMLCGWTLDGGEATLRFKADRYMRITLTDAGGIMAGGEVTRRTATVRPDTISSVPVDVTTHRNFAGVTVDTGATLYAVPMQEQTSLLPGSPQSEDPAIAATVVFLLFASAIPLAWVGVRRFSGGVEDAI